MPDGLKWFEFPIELLHTFSLLDCEVVGSAMKALSDLSKYGDMPDGLSTAAERLFFDAKFCLEKSRAKYEEQVKRNTANAHKGAGRPKKKKAQAVNQVDFDPISIGNQADFKPIAEQEEETEKEEVEKESKTKPKPLSTSDTRKEGCGGKGASNLEQSADFEERRNAGIAKLQAYQATKNGGDFN